MSKIVITAFKKIGGPLTKSISLATDGTIKSDGSACVMSRGIAQRVQIEDVHALGERINDLGSEQAIALGALRADLPDKVTIITKREINGTARSNIIARTGANIIYQKGEPALALLDYDTKGMPAVIAAKLKAHGGFWSAVLSVVPELRDVAHVFRRSTSAGLYRADTGEKLRGSDGAHVFVVVQDGADVERFLQVLHERCWLAGLGWMIVGAAGQLLERSIVDRMVGAPERLVFEGPPVLDPPLAQDQESRRPIAVDGAALDSLAVCPPLTIAEMARLREIKAKEAHRLAPASAKARTAFVAAQAKRLVERTGMSAEEAEHTIGRQCSGILLPDVELPFDDPDLAGMTVADVLADPARFEGATLADPLEGVKYGRCVARIMRRADGTPGIHSFAHGRAVYILRYDAKSIRKAIEAAEPENAAKTLVAMVAAADLDAVEIEALRNLAAKRSDVAKRTISGMLKTAVQEQKKRTAAEERNRRLAERRDPRPSITAPHFDEPWIPVMVTLNEILSDRDEPPKRDVDSTIMRPRLVPVPDTHPFTSASANQEQTT